MLGAHVGPQKIIQYKNLSAGQPKFESVKKKKKHFLNIVMSYLDSDHLS